MKLKYFVLILSLGLLSACQSGSKDMDYEMVENAEAADAMNMNEVQVSDRVFFDFDQSYLRTDAKKVLDKQSKWLMQEPKVNVIIEGHCDERGTREYNLALGERRAMSVKKYLMNKGVNSSRITTISYGKERPAFVGTGEKVWSKNRRAVTVMEK